MAKALQTPVSATVNGVVPTLAAPNGTGGTNGDIVAANAIVYIENGSGGILTVTVKQPSTIDGQAVTDKAIAIAIGAKAIIGPWTNTQKQLPGTTDADKVYLEYSTVTSVTRFLLVTPW